MPDVLASLTREVNGLRGIFEKDATAPAAIHSFYMVPWQWWVARLLGMAGTPVKSSLLIPRQKTAY